MIVEKIQGKSQETRAETYGRRLFRGSRSGLLSGRRGFGSGGGRLLREDKEKIRSEI
jgi:hypothetical protein